MTVAKWVARFELGLTTTTPTVTFARNQVFRTPDLLSDTLTISYEAMRQIMMLFRANPVDWAECAPEDYVPSELDRPPLLGLGGLTVLILHRCHSRELLERGNQD